MQMIKKPKTVPYYGGSSISEKLKTAKRITGDKSQVIILLKKLLNRSFHFMAYYAPVNSWRVRLHKWRGVQIGEGVFIGMHVIIDRAYPDYVLIDDYAMLAGGNHLLAHSRAPQYFKGKLLSYVAPIVLEKYCWLGIESIVLAGSTVGQGSVITAGSVVTGDIQPHVIVRGNPAEVIKKLQ